MLDYTLSGNELADLRAARRDTRDKREADRIKAVVLATGWTAEQVTEALQVDPNTVRNHFKLAEHEKLKQNIDRERCTTGTTSGSGWVGGWCWL